MSKTSAVPQEGDEGNRETSAAGASAFDERGIIRRVRWRDSNGERWKIQKVNMEEGGVLVPKPADVAYHRAFSSDSGKQRIYAFRSVDHRAACTQLFAHLGRTSAFL